MQPLIDYLNAGGTWTWVSFGAGVLGLLALLRAFFARYRQGAALLAAELGFVSMVCAGIAWWQAREQGTVVIEGTKGTQVYGEVTADAAHRRRVPVRIGLGVGLPPLLLGGVMAAFSGSKQRGARQ